MTGQEALAAARARLAAAGVADPARDAQALLAGALGIERGRLILHLDAPLDPAAETRFEAMLAARATRQPVAQILGRRAFWGRDFEVTPAVLDPRPETEALVALALAAPFARMIDLGTGSGAILVSCLAGRPAATGLGTDVSGPALEVARRNAERHGVADRAAFRRADWWAGIEGRFDLVVSNPPYIAEAEIAALAPEVRDWEPRGALTPGGDGLEAYRRIAAGLGAHLRPGGRVLLEIGPTQGAAVLGLLGAAGLENLRLHPDLDGRDRVAEAWAP